MWRIVGKVASRAFQRYTTYGPCDRYVTCRDVFKVNQVPYHVRCRWKDLVKSIPTMHEIRPLWTFAKRWHKKFTKRSYNVSKTFTQRLNNVDTAFTKRYWSCSETVPPLGYTRLKAYWYKLWYSQGFQQTGNLRFHWTFSTFIMRSTNYIFMCCSYSTETFIKHFHRTLSTLIIRFIN
jgi:hypothetical protein